jgi:hypothetical protein
MANQWLPEVEERTGLTPEVFECPCWAAKILSHTHTISFESDLAIFTQSMPHLVAAVMASTPSDSRAARPRLDPGRRLAPTSASGCGAQATQSAPEPDLGPPCDVRQHGRPGSTRMWRRQARTSPAVPRPLFNPRKYSMMCFATVARPTALGPTHGQAGGGDGACATPAQVGR